MTAVPLFKLSTAIILYAPFKGNERKFFWFAWQHDLDNYQKENEKVLENNLWPLLP